MLKVLFLCTGNSCRSQMAEGWARNLLGDRVEAMSAGTHPKGIDPRAVEVMKEAGIDIGGQGSKKIDGIAAGKIDLVVTVCDAAAENCPTLPGAKRIVHHPFDDPPALARTAKSAEEALAHYRRVRDEIRTFVLTIPKLLEAR